MPADLSVVIPAYNEEERVEETVVEVAEYLAAAGVDFEVLVINDGSTDATSEKARRAAARFPQVRLVDRAENLGKGRTVREGIRLASRPYCLFMDADNATSISEWPRFEEAFEKGFRVVVASRHLPESRILHPQPLTRRVLGTGYRWLARRLFGLRCSDFNCGFKAYETALAQEVYSRLTREDWTFDVETFCLLKRMEVPFAEVPVRWSHRDKASAASLWGPFRAAFGSLRSLLKLKTLY